MNSEVIEKINTLHPNIYAVTLSSLVHSLLSLEFHSILDRGIYTYQEDTTHGKQTKIVRIGFDSDEALFIGIEHRVPRRGKSPLQSLIHTYFANMAIPKNGGPVITKGNNLVAYKDTDITSAKEVIPIYFERFIQLEFLRLLQKDSDLTLTDIN